MTMARYSGVVQDQAGNIIPNAKIEVRRETPGAPLAAIKEDRDGLVALTNPFNAADDGSFFFHVVGGFYKIRAYTGASGAPTYEKILRYVPIGELQGYDLDALLVGKRQQVRVATTANITIATALNNGDSIDGVTLATSDLVLVKDQTSKAENGVYVVGVSPARSAEFDTYNEHAGAMVAVVEGTAGAGSVWFCTANSGGTLGTTAIDFTELAATAGPPGADGEQGPPGPATIAIGTVTTVAAGENATVTNSGTSEDVILDFEIPEGEPGPAGGVVSVVAGTNVTVDDADPANPVISATGGIDSVVAGTNITVDNTDPSNPVISSAAASGGPIVLLASGQSNISMYQTYSWTPPTNLFLWDFDGQVDAPTVTGTAFYPMTSANMAVAYSFGAKLAEANPSRPVYVVNVGNGGQPISKWLTGSPSPDMYDCLKRNIEAALTAIGVSTVDTFLWWQGEADAVLNNTGYASDFATLQARLKSETWFPIATPVLMMSVSPYYSDARVKYFNPVLRAVAGMDPAVRTFVQTNKLPSTMWQSPELIHMTGDGYKTAGEFAYTTYLTGCAAAGINPWVMIFKPVSETRTATTTLASDKYLRFPMKSGISYRVRGVINVTAAGTTAGFKYGWSGPACAATFTRLSVIQATETSSFAIVGAGYPTNKTITPGAAFSGGVEFEMSVVAVSADGEFAFQWSQNTSDAVNGSGVYAASYMEYVEG